MCVVPNGEFVILEIHPIQEELHGSGNGLLVVPKSIDEIFACIDLQKGVTSICGCVLHSIPISYN